MKTYYIKPEDCRDIGWAYEIDGRSYDGNLIIDVGKTILIKGDQTIKGNQTVEGNQIVKGEQLIKGYQRVKGNQLIKGYQIVKGNQAVEGKQFVRGKQRVEGSQLVKGYQTVEWDQYVKGKTITGMCKWLVVYYKNKIKIGCETKTTKEWVEWFGGEEEYETPRNSPAFNQIYKTFLMAKVAQENDSGLVNEV